MATYTHNVYLDGKKVDTVFDQEPEAKAVRLRLIRHDGYNESITVRRVWRTEYVLQANYGYGWEDECSEETSRECKRCLREYRANAPGYCYRTIKRKAQA